MFLERVFYLENIIITQTLQACANKKVHKLLLIGLLGNFSDKCLDGIIISSIAKFFSSLIVEIIINKSINQSICYGKSKSKKTSESGKNG